MYRSLWFEFKRNLREEKDHNAVAENESKKAENQEVFADDELEQVVRHFLFTHRGETDDCPSFSISEESDGTVAWLAIAVPALETLRRRGAGIVAGGQRAD